MKLATWNVNSLTVRLAQVLDWLASEQPDVLCLQETKQEDKKFPYDLLKEHGYNAVHAGQKTYNGVAILSRHPIEQISHGMTGFEDDQQRLISATIQGIRVVCAYMPNGQSVDSDKYQYKLNWLNALTNHLDKELQRYPQLALLGDFNIAPEDQDVYDPIAWQGSILVSDPERQAFQNLLALGLHDSFLLFEQAPKQYSWWDYRMMAFRRNLGLRIDHILLSDALKSSCVKSWIDKTPRKLERPSDHTPVVSQLADQN